MNYFFFLKSPDLVSLPERFFPDLRGLSDLKDPVPDWSERNPRLSPRGSECSRDLNGLPDLKCLSESENGLRDLNGLSSL